MCVCGGGGVCDAVFVCLFVFVFLVSNTVLTDNNENEESCQLSTKTRMSENILAFRKIAQTDKSATIEPRNFYSQ